MPRTEEELDTIIRENFRELQKSSGFSDWKHNIEEGQWVSTLFQNLAKSHGFPDTWVAGGLGVMFYYVGFWCGKDNDLICVRPNVQTEVGGENSLSPVCASRFIAFIGFALKAILLKIDDNMIYKGQFDKQSKV